MGQADLAIPRCTFYPGGIRPYQVLLRLPRGRIYIALHVQENNLCTLTRNVSHTSRLTP